MPNDEYAICPYDRHHRVLQYRMPGHVVKCEANYIGPPLAICAYNASHRVLPRKMREHLISCPDFHSFHQLTYLAVKDLEI